MTISLKNTSIAIIILFQCSLPLLGCTCVPYNFAAVALQYSHTVFLGKVTEIVPCTVKDSSEYYNLSKKSRNSTLLQFVLQNSPTKSFYKVKFLCEYVFKGKKNRDTIEVITGVGSGDCGYHFEEGKEYVVYCRQKNKLFPRNSEVQEFLATDICTHTQLKNEKEIEELEKLTSQPIPLTTKIIYSEYIIVKDTGNIQEQDMLYTPILPSKYREQYSQDTMYVWFNDEFQSDTVKVYRINGMGTDELIYSKLIQTKADSVSVEGFTIHKNNNDVSLFIIQVNEKFSTLIYLEQNLSFINIWYDRLDEIVTVEMSNKVLDSQ